MKKLITQEGFGIVALTTLLIPQIAHTVYVFQVNSQYTNPWFGWMYALGVELAILIFTVKGWRKTALAYLLGTVAHNLVYQFWPESIVSAVLICLMLSATIYSFSHLFYSKQKEEKEVVIPEPVRQMAAQLVAFKERGIAIHPQPYRCPACQKTFGSAKELNGHVSGHKQKGDWQADAYGNWEQQIERNVEFLKQQAQANKAA